MRTLHSREHLKFCKTDKTLINPSAPLFFSLEKNLLAVGVEVAVVAVGFAVTAVLVSLGTAGGASSAVGPAEAIDTGCTSVDMVGTLQGKEEKGTQKAPQNMCSQAIQQPHILSTGPRRAGKILFTTKRSNEIFP